LEAAPTAIRNYQKQWEQKISRMKLVLVLLVHGSSDEEEHKQVEKEVECCW
jgi:hypothetical protein